MQRYFVDRTNWTEDGVVIKGDDVHHMTRVMRMQEGDAFICIHPVHGPALCEIDKIAPGEKVTGAVREWVTEDKELPVKVTIVQSLGKGDKLEQVVQKGTELGACSFIPFEAKRSVVKWDAKKAKKKISRLQKIAKEASEQSERSTIPDVSDVMSMTELIRQSYQYDVKMIAYEREARSENHRSLAEQLQQVKRGQSVIILFGPEGGFTPEEADQLFLSDFLPVRLGPRILRMETAPLYFLSSLSYQIEELP
ncbi:16S rRNA (uracil(1498)-N(3))-methyltransferase [Halobacillus naozhouensis]|uniref:Ribosomal RNA small subunit methyltransferase E n=1 Tax=Halobacillus naozhouensis TaxID=554880 RepID=A0ABY8IVT6_9BACI|nr:16S rRNA (uracil(1498)-N(3))-methyltransferase [Halobacillus naozhouensis]WFT73299.1 16S rRNA (uracil(1498)-N(3))-methyltransferase [Halobacillus naozhouensis]